MNSFKLTSIEYNLLKAISQEIDAYYNNTSSDETTRPYFIYEFIRGRKLLSGKFSSQLMFYRFLKNVYNADAKLFRQMIPCDVDVSDPKRYSWRFYRKEKKISNEVNAESVITRSNYFRENRNIPTNNKDLARSTHEEYIYNRLLNERDFKVFYEGKSKDDKLPDFKIWNLKTNIVYRWEHFGMLENLDYATKADEKIQWYKDKGFKFIQYGGTLIITTYKNENEFLNEVEKMINLIKVL